MARFPRVMVGALSMLLVGAGVAPNPASAAAKPELSAASTTVGEGVGSGKATIVLKLDRKPKGRTKVSWRAVEGSATAGKDFKKKSGEIVFDVGQRSRKIQVAIIDDAVSEKSETFYVRLRSSQARVPAKDVRVVIRDNDVDEGADGFQVEVASARATSHTFDDRVSADNPTLLGATMTATGPDGTVYTLEVPDGALAAETMVTMTPWKSATGTGVTGGRLAGVRLTPSGTEFLLPVTLRIDPPGADDVPAVTLAREGDQSYGYPAALETERLVLQLTHFSDYYAGIGEGTSIQIVYPTPLDPAQTLATEMELTLREERNRQLEGADPDPAVMEKIGQLMTSYYDNVVAPLLPDIRVECTQAQTHNGQVLGFARQAALLGMLAAQQQTILDAVIAGAENCLQEAIEPCVDQTDAAQMTQIFASWRLVLLLGGTVPDPDPLDPVRHCQDLVSGVITITFDKVLEVNGFRTEEDYKIVFQPRLVNPKMQQMWFDDGRGGWSVSGTYRQTGEDAQCPPSERTYSGSGTFFTGPHGDQLNPDVDQGKGKAELEFFFPWYEDNFGMVPEFDGEVVGTNTRTTYIGEDCAPKTEEVPHWFPATWGFGKAPGVVVDTPKGPGVELSYTFTQNKSEGDKIDTVTVAVVGSLLPTQG